MGVPTSIATFEPSSGCTRCSSSAARASQSTTGDQRLVVDLDELAGVLGDVAALGDHERDRVADEAHVVAGEEPQRRARAGLGARATSSAASSRAPGSRSAAVRTACTPSSARAASTSRRVMRRARDVAAHERRVQHARARSRRRRRRPCPVSRRGSSRRRTDWPTKRPAVGRAGWRSRAHCSGRAAASRTALTIPW